MGEVVALYADIRIAGGNAVCGRCERLLDNYPTDRHSAPVRGRCWGCFTSDWKAPDMAEKSKAWSYSHISAFEICPRLYGERYHHKRLPYVETPQMAKGNKDHQKLYLRLSSKTMPVPLPPDLEAMEPICRSIERAPFVHAEMPVAITKDLKSVDYWDPLGWQRGKIDVAALGHTAGSAFDWKTGNPNFENPFQLAIYAVDLMVRFPHLESVTVANIWLKTGKPGTPRVYKRKEDLPRLAADMYERWDNVERATNAGAFPPTPNNLCTGCDVLSCEFRKEKRAA